MLKISKDYLPNETGGTLIGHYSNDNLVAFIDKVIGVRKGGKFTEKFFFRPSDFVDNQLAKIYKKSKGKKYYLGEWHTHPYSSTIPSALDIKTMKSISMSKKVATKNPLLIILGGDFISYFNINCFVTETVGKIYMGIIDLGDISRTNQLK